MNLQKFIYGIAGATTQLLGFVLGIQVPTLNVLGAATFGVAPTMPNVIGAMVALVDGANVAVNAVIGSTFTLTCANNNARVISVPTGGVAGQRIVVRLVNTSAGALTLTTFAAAIKQPALTYPATLTTKEFELFFDGTEWELTTYSPANIPN